MGSQPPDLVTTYVVGGMPRSGTSMMMRALAAGGLDPLVDDEKDAALTDHWEHRRAAGYDPNPGGVLEPGTLKGRRDFPELMRGRLVKLMGGGAADGRYAGCRPIRVAFIYRDQESVHRSHLAAFGRAPEWVANADGYNRFISSRISHQMSRPWVQDVTCFAYEDVVANPLLQFSRLAELGWPIDPAAAAASVDRALNRNGGTGPVYPVGRPGPRGGT